jgi:hypothetical protein
MNYKQNASYLPEVTVLVNRNGNLAFKSKDDFMAEEQVIEVSKELFLMLIINKDQILSDMDEIKENCELIFDEEKNDA